MADACDLGSDRAQQMLDDALAARIQKASRPAIDHPYCLDCDEAIPLKRREALPGVECCVDCQQLRERSGVGNG
ncbi:TraR/DksA family transcriptional regulator [Halopseudomonas aestusnigri]|uniref:TraR/DksA family transcriptional regulator n=1 Tax=Halopseudomonas aestusnigri TaxID=857252 RepID=UPI001E4B72BB|nr:TraR/DksA family transcriptional regulator [Halopseudomonas aestusnigri]UGV30942.1 TraR/DksA family transcriptional regulator [Halopseudomonas aestusnigri]